MNHLLRYVSVVGMLLVLVPSDSRAIGPRGGGARGGGAIDGARGYGVAGPYGGSSVGTRTTGQVVGPRGGTGQTHTGSGTVTTPRGGTVEYKGGAVGGTTAGGVTGGKYVGGIQVTTPGGREATKVGTGGAAVGPGGNAVAGRSGVVQASGPGGTASGAYRGGVAIGPQGAAAGGTRVGTATGAAGTVSGAARGGVAVGPYGAAAGGTKVAAGPGGAVAARGGAVTTAHGTYYRSAAAISGQGAYIRRGFAHYDCFTPRWYARYPGAWFAAGWAAGAAWRTPTWGAIASYGSYPSQPVYYDYGSNVVYEGDTVYIEGEPAATAAEYSQYATTLADAGREAKPAKDEEFLPLGVFALVQGDEQTAYHIFQLAINKKGVIRGNYYNAVADSTEPVYGSVDKNTQRAAWTVGERKTPVYDVGLANLTRDETTLLIHYDKAKTQQWTLVRIEKPKEEPGMEK